MRSLGSCRGCSKVHEANPCVCGHEYHGHGHGVAPVIGGGRCLNCRCQKYTPDGEVRWTTVTVPRERMTPLPLSEEERVAAFTRAVQRLQRTPPEERERLTAELGAINVRLGRNRALEAHPGESAD